MTYTAHSRPGLVLVAASAQLYDEQTPPARARFAIDLVATVGAIALAYSLSLATRVTRRR